MCKNKKDTYSKKFLSNINGLYYYEKWCLEKLFTLPKEVLK